MRRLRARRSRRSGCPFVASAGSQLRQVTDFSLYLFLIGIAIQLGTKMDALVIGVFLGTSAVAVYTVAMRIAEYQRQFCGQISTLLFPVVVRFHANENQMALRTTLLEGTRLSVALVAGLTVCLLAYGSQLIQIWMGPGFESAVGPFFVLILLGVVIVAQGPTGNILLGAGRHRLVAALSIVDVRRQPGIEPLFRHTVRPDRCCAGVGDPLQWPCQPVRGCAGGVPGSARYRFGPRSFRGGPRRCGTIAAALAAARTACGERRFPAPLIGVN